MHARVPQDVDLEDRLLFGLTATRFGEVALAALCALAAWRLVPIVGGVLAGLLIAAGGVFGWARWRGRGADHWLVCTTYFLLRTRRLEIDRTYTQQVIQRIRHRRSPPGSKRVTETALPRPPRQPLRARPSLRVLDGPVE